MNSRENRLCRNVNMCTINIESKCYPVGTHGEGTEHQSMSIWVSLVTLGKVILLLWVLIKTFSEELKLFQSPIKFPQSVSLNRQAPFNQVHMLF